ncbi:MAG: hypothetical protein K6E96_08210 [Bacteroidales bacterium]|nr:hypothetical protein [Bacteroidales bacterium]
MKVSSFRFRASYPNYYMVNLYAREGREIFNHDSEDPANQLEGNKPGTVIYRLEGDSKENLYELPPRWYDMYTMLRSGEEERRHYIEMLLDEADGNPCIELDHIRDAFREECREYAQSHPLTENEYLITTLSKGDYSDEEISYKGRMLMDLTRNCYPVPDFCILTSRSFNRPDLLPELTEKAISKLETMANCRLGDSHSPLVFAIRCAMPQYIPGLMPTLLNIGVTRTAYEALRTMYADAMANRVYLSTLHSLGEMLDIEHRYTRSDISLSEAEQRSRIAEMEARIEAVDARLLTDAHYQALRLILHVRQFYIDHSDLILTFMQGKQAFPSLILQRMVWTIGNNESYPGVLYSRHSRTGVGKQVESYRNIFGEEIMTGDVTTEDLSYRDRSEIRRQFPAVYHFDPLLKKLEARYHTPVTIEFAVESRPHQLSLFSVLQLNASEMTGRAALISSINLRNEGIISDADVTDLIKPYHLRQIVSASIDDRSLSKLQFFGHGLSVLPRTAISARLCLSVAKAREWKAKGQNVCLCQEHFVPEDTITLNEVDAILSMLPAAIHVVTACRGYGIPAFMDLQSYGIRIEGDSIVNAEGLSIAEGDLLTVSSRRQSLYRGQADFRPARFTKYLQGAPVELTDAEQQFFEEMKQCYLQYQAIVNNQQASYITDLSKLARLVRLDLHDKPKQAAGIVNSWFESRPDDYVDGVLKSRMGDHNDQSRLFNLLDTSHKISFFQRISAVCIERSISGLTAGSFMIGRFMAHPLPVHMWNSLSDTIVAFLLNEYVLYEKYQQVLQEVGEIKLARAHSRIETEGIDNMVLRNFDLTNFYPLLHSNHQWPAVATALEQIDHQDNTHLLVEMLGRPLDELFDLSTPWKRAQLEEVMRQAGV